MMRQQTVASYRSKKLLKCYKLTKYQDIFSKCRRAKPLILKRAKSLILYPLGRMDKTHELCFFFIATESSKND